MTSPLPPQSEDAERAVLGSVLLKQDAMFEIDGLISELSFYSARHRHIFRAMLELHDAGKPVDLLSLSEQLSQAGKLEEVGRDSYLAELATTVPTAANVLHYAQIVFEKYNKRRLIDAGSKAMEYGFDDRLAIEQALDQAEQEFSGIGQDISGSDFHSMHELSVEAAKRLEGLKAGEGKLRGLPTGFTSLDKKLSGFQKSDLIILAARPAVGKTSLALDFARKIAINHDKSIAFFSLEMSKDQLTDRLLAAEARVDAWRMRTGNIQEAADYAALEDAIGRLKSAKIHIDDSSYNNILRIKSAARKLKSRSGLDLVIVDYLQLMAPMSLGKDSTMVQQVTEISRGLKQLAKELDVPVIALSQLSRNVEHRGENAEPRLADLRDSGSIEQDADIVMFIHRNKSDDSDGSRRSNEAKLIIEKHRNGATGVIELYFDDSKSSFTEQEGSIAEGAEDFSLVV